MTGSKALADLSFDETRHQRLVLAVGGNALTGHQVTTIEGEFASAGPVADAVAALPAGGAQVVVTHGNGPQVGFILRRSELTAHLKEELPELPLDYCVAETQGGLGYVLASEIGWALRRRRMTPSVVALMTQTMISRRTRGDWALGWSFRPSPEVGGINPLPGTAVADQTPAQEHHVE
jgi:carbamate kinase